MNKLPTEVIAEITSHLQLTDKLNLAITNKQIHKTPTETTLYSKLVFKNTSQYGKAMKLLEKDNNFNYLVRYLDIKMDNYNAEFIVNLPTIFSGFRSLWCGDIGESGAGVNLM